jgi:hypothetical protein
MLTTIGAGSAANKPFDYAGYSQSKLHCSASIELVCAGASEINVYPFHRSTSRYSGVAVMPGYDDLLQVSSYNVIRLLVSVVVAVLFGTCTPPRGFRKTNPT